MKQIIRIFTLLFLSSLCAVSLVLASEQPAKQSEKPQKAVPARQTAPSEQPAVGTITGSVVHADGKAFTSGFVAFFHSDKLDPMDYGSTRRSPKMVALLDEKGHFTTIEMPVGAYYIGAMERKGWRGGPPKRGEKRYSAFDDKGKYRIISLESGKVLDLGKIVVTEPAKFPEITDFFTISGRILNKDGKAIPDVVVVMKQDYANPKADFISDQTDSKGRYTVKLPPGRYYLVARETVLGTTRPKTGSLYGELGQDEPIGIGGKTANPATYIIGGKGKVYENVDITMFKVPIPEVKRKETEAMVKAQKLSKKNLPKNLPMRKKTEEAAVELKVKSVK